MFKLLISGLTAISLLGCHPVLAQQGPTQSDCIPTADILAIGPKQFGQEFFAILKHAQGQFLIMRNPTKTTWIIFGSCPGDDAGWVPIIEGDKSISLMEMGKPK